MNNIEMNGMAASFVPDELKAEAPFLKEECGVDSAIANIPAGDYKIENKRSCMACDFVNTIPGKE